jgi:hypothetical protein
VLVIAIGLRLGSAPRMPLLQLVSNHPDVTHVPSSFLEGLDAST